MLRLLSTACLVASGAAAAWAGPLETAWIPADAKWIVHVDIEAGARSTLGRYAMNQREIWERPEVRRAIQETGIEFPRDIHGITIYGNSCEPDDAVAVIVTTAATDSFLEKLRAQEPSYLQIQGEQYQLESWSEHGSPRFGFVRRTGVNDRLILVGRDQKRLEQAIALTEPDSQVLKSSCKLVASPPRAGSILFAAAHDIGETSARARAVLVQKMNGLRLEVGEIDEAIFAEASLDADSAEDAANLQQMLEGAMAMGRMMAQSRPEAASLKELSQSVAFGRSDTVVSMSFRHDSARVLDMLKIIHDAHKAKAAPAAETDGSTTKP